MFFFRFEKNFRIYYDYIFLTVNVVSKIVFNYTKV